MLTACLLSKNPCMPRPPSNRKPRASSLNRIATILEAARSLLSEQGMDGLSIYSVAGRAEIPPSSVYHFYASVPALLETLAADIHAAFRDALHAPIDDASITTWRDLSRILERRMLAIYASDTAARQLILTQHGLTELNQADSLHDLELGRSMQALFERYFYLPVLPDDIDVFALAMELGDRVYARSVQQHGVITPRLAEEGMRVFDAYLGLYLPPFLRRREGTD
jgi:AcrR family transcriptional regulator